jgi:DNA-binding transcriptional MerR regulator/effector-binding domain-containing protein
MFTIGEFATVARVSVRMLRHYDAIGLLVPARVEEHNGYRYYGADQLRTLNRLLALKDLGFTLEQVGRFLDEDVAVAELRGMLRLRRSELAARIDADRDRLSRVEARLRIIESEDTMSTTGVGVKPVGPVRVAAVTGRAASAESSDIGPVVQELFAELGRHVGRGAVVPAGLAVATYSPTEDGGMRCRAGITVAGGARPERALPDGVELVDLPALDAAATLVHHGAMATIGGTYQRLAVWVEENGYRTDGTAREVYLVSVPQPQESWVTEIQMPVAVR